MNIMQNFGSPKGVVRGHSQSYVDLQPAARKRTTDFVIRPEQVPYQTVPSTFNQSQQQQQQQRYHTEEEFYGSAHGVGNSDNAFSRVAHELETRQPEAAKVHVLKTSVVGKPRQSESQIIAQSPPPIMKHVVERQATYVDATELAQAMSASVYRLISHAQTPEYKIDVVGIRCTLKQTQTPVKDKEDQELKRMRYLRERVRAVSNTVKEGVTELRVQFYDISNVLSIDAKIVQNDFYRVELLRLSKENPFKDYWICEARFLINTDAQTDFGQCTVVILLTQALFDSQITLVYTKMTDQTIVQSFKESG